MRKLLLFILTILLAQGLKAQFYLGHQMTFGKNRVQYRNFVWRYIRYPRFDVYYYEGGKPIGYFIAKYAQEVIPQMERFFDYNLKKRIIFITYNNLREFKQSNLGLFTGNLNLELAASTQILSNKVIIFYQDDHQKLKNQIREQVAKLILQEMLFGRGFTKRFYGANTMSVPDWFIDGLASYAADPYNLEIDNYMRDLVLHSKKIKLSNLKPEQAKFVGHSFWVFISETFGQDVIPNIIYFLRVSKNLSNAFYYVLGIKLKQLNSQWFQYAKEKYLNQVAGRQPIDSALILKKYRKRPVYQQIQYCRKNDLFAYVINDLGRYKVIIYDPQKHKRKVIYRQGQRLPQITDFSYPQLIWKPDGSELTFTTEEKGIAYIHRYNVETHKHSKAALSDLTKIYSINYSQDGRFLVLSAQKDGFIDIYVYNNNTGVLQRITWDPYDDLYPAFTDHARKIIFSSNRGNDLLLKRTFNIEQRDSLQRTFDLYLYDFRHRAKQLKRLTNTWYSNEFQAFALGKDLYVFLSDSSGIVNRITVNFDSTVDYVDTVVHYRYFTRTYPITNYPTSILQHSLASDNKTISENKLWYKRYLLSSYKQNFKPQKKITDNFTLTDTREKQIALMRYRDQIRIQQWKQKQRQQRIADSIAQALKSYRPKVRDTFVDINNYLFEIERDTLLGIYYNYQQKLKRQKQEQRRWGRLRVYQPTFYLTNFSTSFDYGQLVQSYQPFTGGGFVFSPGMNLFSVLQINELMEDYRIFGGFRLNNDLRSLEYILSFEDLHRRLDKQILFHRNAVLQNLGFVGYNYTMTKNIINELILAARYPFNQVASVRASVMARYDKKIYLATDQQVFDKKPENNYFASAKLEFIYDNSRPLALNLYDGIRAKAFVEGYQQIMGQKYWTAIVGADFRFYKQIWRNMIFAWRFAGSTNTGSGKLIYYLGGVDYWYILNLNPLAVGNKMFYQDVNINYANNYIFQAVATPMRGFKQNIRNGTTFLLMNTELRMPIFQMLFNTPASSEFWYNFQVIGFFDVGSAWCGASPMSDCNTYNTYYVYNPPVTMIVDLERPPVVEGVGFGIRTKLLGYFVRFDFAWGIEHDYIHPMQFYLSLAYDF